jgi:hypothetical protein
MEIKYISLFDYLGRPAGKEIGGRVNERAREFGITSLKRFVRNKNYEGKVNLYPEAFLEYYFNNLNNMDAIYEKALIKEAWDKEWERTNKDK